MVARSYFPSHPLGDSQHPVIAVEKRRRCGRSGPVHVSEIRGLRTSDSTRAFKPPRGTLHDNVGCEDATSNQGPGSAASLTTADLNRSDLTGLRLGHYVLGPRIGSGGMGQVFICKHETLGKQFALKFMAEPARMSSEGTHRFQLEVESLGRLNHPSIVSAVDAGCFNGVHFLVTELVAGNDLSQVVATEGPLGEERACRIFLQVASGLSHAHSHGFVHRDIKPSNLIVDEHGVVRILDFGLVRSQQHSTEMTCPGLLMGTIDFLSPEQAADGRMADHRSDLYSLGCTLLYLLTGKVPYSGDQFCSMPAKIHGHLFLEPAALSNGELQVSSRMETVLARLLQKRPDDRFQSANEVIEFLNGDTSFSEQSGLTRAQVIQPVKTGAGPSRGRPYSFVFAGSLLAAIAGATVGRSNLQHHRTETSQAFPTPSSTDVAATGVTATGDASIEPQQELNANLDEHSGNAVDSKVDELTDVETITTAFRTAESGRVRNRMSGKFLSGKPGTEPVNSDSKGRSAEPIKPMKGNE